MANHREAILNSKDFVESAPMPKDVPHVDELGTTSAPLKSASFFIGDKCKEVNDDFMLCKNENNNPAHCLAEGRKVTRCAQDVISKIRENCLEEFDAHWKCLEFNNQNLTKSIPGSPANQPQIHEKENPIYKRQQK